MQFFASTSSRLQAQKGRRHVPGERGLTLIEILVVVTILGMIAGLVGIGVANSLSDAKVDAGNIQIKNLSDALDLYKIKFNRYPTTAEGLQALSSPPNNKKPIMETVPKDPWGQDFIYVCPGTHNTRKFDIQSKGDDGVADTEDDLKNW